MPFEFTGNFVSGSLPGASEPFDVAIIGGGAAGVLVAIHLLDASKRQARIILVEPQPNLGQGVAYSTAYPEHLLNVIAGRMSAFDSDPSHFVRYLEAAETATTDGTMPHRFARRLDFGRYLHATLEAKAAPESLQWRDEAIDVVGNGPYAISLRSGRSIAARSIVLAVGNFPRALPIPASAILGEPRIDNAWDYAIVRSIEPDADVCIIGSGLTMVDAAISLAERGHRGQITVLSRHGLMPLAHATAGVQEGDIIDLLGLNVRARIRALRARATAGLHAGEPWQWTMDRLRPHGQALWLSLGKSEQSRFLRHALRFWDIHRHRIAPAVATRIAAMRFTGQMVVQAGHVTSIIGDSTRCQVRFRPRAETHERELSVHRVLNGIGVETSLARMQSSLMKTLASRGVISPGPHDIGMATDGVGVLLAADGTAQSNILTLGASRIGQCWESIAIPELRRQAQDISEYLLDRIHGHSCEVEQKR